MQEFRDWMQYGFAAPPRPQVAHTGLILYRSWGGSNNREWGRFFTSLRPRSVLEAEAMCNIVEWGNAVYFVSTFRVLAGTPMMVGRIAHGNRDVCIRAEQYLIEEPEGSLIRLHCETLHYDAFVSERVAARDRRRDPGTTEEPGSGHWN